MGSKKRGLPELRRTVGCRLRGRANPWASQGRPSTLLLIDDRINENSRFTELRPPPSPLSAVRSARVRGGTFRVPRSSECVPNAQTKRAVFPAPSPHRTTRRRLLHSRSGRDGPERG